MSNASSKTSKTTSKAGPTAAVASSSASDPSIGAFGKIDRVPWHAALGVALVIVLYFAAPIVSSLLVSIYPLAQHWTTAEANTWLQNSVWAQFVFIAIAEALTVGAIYLFIRHYKVGFRTIGLLRPRWRDLLFGLLAAVAYYVLYLLTIPIATHLVPSLNVNQTQEIGFTNVHGAAQLFVTFISLVILPPLTEEILVRGVLYSSLRKALPRIIAALVTSAMFASAHLPEGGAAGPLYIAALDTFILSIVLVSLRELTGTLWPGVVTHGIKNGVAFLALFIINVH